MALIGLLDRTLFRVVSAAAQLLILSAVAAAFYQVLARFVLQVPADWSGAWTRFALIWTVLLGISLAFRQGSMLAVQMLRDTLQGRAQRLLEHLVLIVCLGFLGFMFWVGTQMAWRVRFQTVPSLDISISWIYMAIPVGAGLAIIAVLAHWAEGAQQRRGALMSQLMVLSMLIFLGLSVPVAVAIGLASMAGIGLDGHMTWLVFAQQIYASLDKYPLVAVPFFIMAGNLMEAAGISDRMVDFAKSVVGGMQGGLACSCVLTCMIFAAVAGSSVATTFAVGAILIPAMVHHGYPKPFAAALQATSAELGVIIPPSIPMILFAVSTETSVGELFIAGIGPGLLIGGALMVYVRLVARRRGLGLRDGEGRLPMGLAFKRAWLALLMPTIILGGIYGGVFTPTEASAVAVVYALAVGVLVYRTLSLPVLSRTLHRTVVSTAVIMFVIANAGVFGFLLNRAGVPQALGDWLGQLFGDKFTFLLGVNLALFLIGMFIETSASIVVLAPLLLPVALHFGVEPTHFGVIMVVNLALGMVTPPLGVNLFAASTVAQLPVERLIRPLVPFVFVVFACLMVITYVPALSLFLKVLVYGP